MWLFCIFFWVFIVLSMKSSHCLTKKNTAMKTKHSVGASPWGSWQHRAIFILFFFLGGHSKSLSNLSQHYSSGDVYKNMTLFIFFIFFSSVLHVTSVLRVMTTHMVHVSHLKHSLCFWSSPWDLNSSVWCCRSLWAHASLSIQKVSHLLCRRL